MRSAATVIQNNFTRGLVTEAQALNFPEDAVTDTLNCVFDRRSLVSRRLGFEFEPNYSTLTANQSGTTALFQWDAAGGNGDLSFIVVQIGSIIYFYRVPELTALSPERKSYTINLESLKIAGAPSTSSFSCQFSYGDGRLMIAHPYCNPLWVEYDDGADTFTSGSINVRIRDVEGVDDGLAVTQRPGSLSTAHSYNLNNQGWDSSRVSTYFSSQGVYPANNEVWWVLKNAEDVFTPSTRVDRDRGTSRAPRGSIILDAFNQLRSGLATVSSGFQRPSSVAFYAGRAFYAGVSANRFSNRIYFSQIIETRNQLGECFQENDPTNEYSFDLLPSDGGVINIPEMGQVITMMSVESNLFIFASNGVWAIGGSTGTGFNADDYSVRRVSAVPTLSESSFVDAAGIPIWWNADGIYTVEANSAAGMVQIKSLVDGTIKDFYDRIPPNSKKFAKGFYNPLERRIHWLYRSTDAIGESQLTEYDSVLCLDVLGGAYYPWRIPTNNVKLRGIVSVEGTGSETGVVNVTDNDGVTVTSSVGDVTVIATVTRPLNSIFKYLVSYDSGGDTVWTFAEEKNEGYFDWEILTGGQDYQSFFVTGFATHGEAIRKYQVHYVQIFCENENRQTQFKFRAIWDFAANATSNRWSPEQTITMLPLPFNVDSRKIKVRGHGKTCQFRVESVSGQPFDIVGWAAFETVNSAA
jgi:hypothetical protein